MLLRRELDYLHWLAGETAPLGRVVELGCFLGGSTAALLAGLNESNARNPSVIAYDSFQAPGQEAFKVAPELVGFGLTPNASFLDLYRKLHQDRIEAITLRQGMIPEHACGDLAACLYPEQDAIGLLFIDIAKVWGVHISVLNAFAHHIEPGGIVVQQDFGDFRTPWLILHMWQLRDAFEPFHRIAGTSSYSFKRTTTYPLDLSLLSPDARSIGDATWVDIASYWQSRFEVNEDASGWIAGYRAAHAIHAGRFTDAIDAAREHDRWRDSEYSAGLHRSAGWDEWLSMLPTWFSQRGANAEERSSAEQLASLATERTRSHQSSLAMDLALQRLCIRLDQEEFDALLLYGAGRHTRKLLAASWPSNAPPILCIVDDNPATDSIASRPVVAPPDVPDFLRDHQGARIAVVPSSDAYETEIMPHARKLAAAISGSALPFYESY